MIKIKKSILALLIVLSLGVGALGAFAIGDLNRRGVIDVSDNVYLTKEEYDDYQHLAETYGKADLLRSYIIENYYTDFDVAKMDEGLYYGLFSGLGDIYSGYYSAEDYEFMLSSLTGVYSGIGITMEASETGYVVIRAVNEDGPADKAGIKVDDIIYEVDGESYGASTLDVCAAAIRGERGTAVKLTILRDGEPLEFSIVRDEIKSKTVSSRMLEDGIGYIRLSSFDESSYDDFNEAMKSIAKEGATCFVLDLRSNPGGLVTECMKIADILMDKGTVVYVEDRNGKREYENTTSGRTSMRYVVLVDGGSASCTEILSAGIQDNDEGVIVGTQTYGKGVIQITERLTDGSGIKLTEYQYFSPNGKAIYGSGITPDYVVELTEECFDENGLLVNDLQLEKALELLRE